MATSDGSKIYIIVEFDDGLAIVSSCWLNESEMKCAYPTFRNPTKIKKAVVSHLFPEDNSNWKTYNVIRIFYRTGCIYYLKVRLCSLFSLFVNMSILNILFMSIYIFRFIRKSNKEKLSIAENISDLTADGKTENEGTRNDKEKKSRQTRARKIYSSSEECEFDSDVSEKTTKLLPFPKIADKSCVINNERISASQLASPSPTCVERSKSECQMSSAKYNKSLYKEATINKYTTERRYRDNLLDENHTLEKTEKDKNIMHTGNKKKLINCRKRLVLKFFFNVYVYKVFCTDRMEI